MTTWKKRRELRVKYHKRNSLWLQDQGNLVEYRTLAEMEKIQSQQSEEGQESIDAFTTVMGPELPGFVRLYGRGFSKTTLKQKKSGESSVADTNEMQKKMDELEDRMVEKLELQKRSIRHEVTVDILKRLNCMYPGLQLDVDMLAATCAQPQQEDIQPINRPSASSNIQCMILLFLFFFFFFLFFFFFFFFIRSCLSERCWQLFSFIALFKF